MYNQTNTDDQTIMMNYESWPIASADPWHLPFTTDVTPFELVRIGESLNGANHHMEFQSFFEEKELNLTQPLHDELKAQDNFDDDKHVEVLSLPNSPSQTASSIGDISEEAMSSECSEPCDLSARQDVLGKTLVRSLKRFIVKQFNETSDFKNRTQK